MTDQQIKSVVAVIDSFGDEMLYVDGKKFSPIDNTIYAVDIINAAGGSPIHLTQLYLEFDMGEWPENLSEISGP